MHPEIYTPNGVLIPMLFVFLSRQLGWRKEGHNRFAHIHLMRLIFSWEEPVCV